MTPNCLPIKTIRVKKMFCEWPAWEGTIKVSRLVDLVHEVKTLDGQLLTMWGTDDRALNKAFILHLVFVFFKRGTLYLHCRLSTKNPTYPDLSTYFPIANRLQRALFDLMGFHAMNNDDSRSWLRHASWPVDVFPLRQDALLETSYSQETDNYPFVQVKGNGVHEIPVGPVHAGIIEPGHFRFQVVGERILRLEERLGYTHKGIAKHFQNACNEKAAKLAGRICGDSTAAYAWSYSMAFENAHQYTAPPRAKWLRGLFLERERIMNHLGDIGALGNDAGLRFAQDQFSRLKEIMLRMNQQLFGHRYLMDLIIPGGVSIDLSIECIVEIQREIEQLHHEVYSLKSIYDEHEGLQDRFISTGVVDTALARSLGLLGLVARASGINNDWRADMSFTPYNQLDCNIQTASSGDVAARVAIRFQEIEESLSLMKLILAQLPKGAIYEPLPAIACQGIGIGCVEGWRGPIFTIVCAADKSKLKWAQIHEPSWQNWLALEHAVIGNIVPDFPLINKSLNLSYSGHDG
jgi:Ni,Fe-hydrogenase III large subunit/Ni,Fe-hydrogenase III component G